MTFRPHSWLDGLNWPFLAFDALEESVLWEGLAYGKVTAPCVGLFVGGWFVWTTIDGRQSTTGQPKEEEDGD